MEEKYVDESWKESVASEKLKKEDPIPQAPPIQEPSKTNPDQASTTAQSNAEEMDLEEFNFLAYLSSLAFQAMIFLGEMPNPVTNKVEPNLRQAKFLIDTLLLLRDKTKGNLDKQESDMLNGALYELQTRFIELTNSDEKTP